MDRIVAIVAPALVFTAVLAYGSLIFFRWMGGSSIDFYKIAHVYTFDRIMFNSGKDTLRVENGSLATAVRGGEENYVAIEGDIQIQWSGPPRRRASMPPQSYHKMRLSLHSSDLHRMIEDNRGALREIPVDDPHTATLKRRTKVLFDWPPPSDRFQAIFHLFQLKFYTPPRQGVIELHILDSKQYDVLGTTLSPGPPPNWVREMIGKRPSMIWIHATISSYILFVTCSLLCVVLVAAGGLSMTAHMVCWIGSLIQGELRFAETPIRNLLFVVVILLYAGALISIILFI